MKVHQSPAAMDDESQGTHRATEDALSIAAPSGPEVAATAKRRQFSSSQGIAFWPAADPVANRENGALLRARASIPRIWQRGANGARPPSTPRWRRKTADAKLTSPSRSPARGRSHPRERMPAPQTRDRSHHLRAAPDRPWLGHRLPLLDCDSSRMLKKSLSSPVAQAPRRAFSHAAFSRRSEAQSTEESLSKVGTTGGVFPFAKTHYKVERPT